VTQRAPAPTDAPATGDGTGRAGGPGTGGLYAEVRAAALAAPDADAVVGHDGHARSYRDLLAAVDAATDRLLTEATSHDVLGLAVDDPLGFLAVYLAAARLDRIVVLLDSRLPAAELRRQVERFDISVLVTDTVQETPDALQGAPGPKEVTALIAKLTVSEVPDAALRRERAATGYQDGDFVVHCTSGSTGEPKGIVMSQPAISARVRLWGGDMELTSADTVLCPLPLHHCHGIDVLTLPALRAGATLVLVPGGRVTARGLARRIARHGATVMSGLPVMYQGFTTGRGVDPAALRTLRLVISGSAPLPVEVQRRFRELYGIPLQQVYGLSEIATICFDRAGVGGGSIGTPISGDEHRLEPVRVSPEAAADGTTAGATAADGTAPETVLHELYVRGPALARGYYRDPAATADMFEDGWLRTHDLLHVTPDGWYVRGRRSGFVNVAGNKVGPLEVEAALRDCAGVRESAVVGVPDPVSTERIAALLVTEPGCDLAAVRREAATRLLPHQVPAQYVTAPALPRTPLGKTDYAAVRRLVLTPKPEPEPELTPKPAPTQEAPR
jgi:acyl-CoA synthetase (AMP-forming)/AMP-acid ligase II